MLTAAEPTTGAQTQTGDSDPPGGGATDTDSESPDGASDAASGASRGDNTDDGGLPFTGFAIGGAALAGLLMLLAGMVLRRRGHAG